MYDFLCSVIGDDAAAAEVHHDTFVAAGARIRRLRDPAKVRPWLFAIARHQASRRLSRRSQRKRPLAPAAKAGAPEVTSEATPTRRLKRLSRRRRPSAPAAKAGIPDVAEETTPARRRSRLPGRKRRRGPAPTAEVAVPDLPDDATAAERAELVRATAATLSRRHRVVLDLHLRQGLEGRELAQALGVSSRRAGMPVLRLREEAERALRVLWVARTGRRHCPGLAAILAGWDGRMTRRLSKRVARHADGCRTCLDRRRKVASSLALLATLPPRMPPAAQRDRVLADVKLARRRRRPWPAARGGFPPPLVRPHRRPVGLVAAATVLVAVAAVFVLVDREKDDTRQVAVTDTPTTLDPALDPEFGFDVPELGEDPALGAEGALPGAGDDLAGDLARELGDLDGDLDGSAGAGAPGARRGSGAGGRGGDSSGEGSGGAGGTSAGSVVVDPTTVLEDDGSGACGRAARSPVTWVTLSAPDASAVRSASVSWGGPRPGSEDLVPAEGGSYEAVIGPFDLGAVPAGQSEEVSVTVRAVDAAGKESVQTASFTLRSCD